MNFHPPEAAEPWLSPAAPPGANTEELAQDRQKCAHAELFTLSMCESVPQ